MYVLNTGAFFFFKQKTAYDMRISDWSSDVCSSDLRMPEPQHHLEQTARDLQLALDRLVGIGIGAERNHRTLVARLAQLGIEQRRSIRLVKQLGLEIEARRQVEISVAGACEAVDAAVLAAAIRIDRLRARQVRRLVAGNDRARVFADRKSTRLNSSP